MKIHWISLFAQPSRFCNNIGLICLNFTIFFSLSFSSCGFVRISPRGLEIMKKKLNHKKPLVDQEKKYFLPQFIMKKIKKMKKRKKIKLKYCSVDPTRLLFSNFPGKLNPKKHFPKITRWQHGCHQYSSHQATTRGKTKY